MHIRSSRSLVLAVVAASLTAGAVTGCGSSENDESAPAAKPASSMADMDDDIPF